MLSKNIQSVLRGLVSVRTASSAGSFADMCEHLYRSGGKCFAGEGSILIRMPELRSG